VECEKVKNENHKKGVVDLERRKLMQWALIGAPLVASSAAIRSAPMLKNDIASSASAAGDLFHDGFEDNTGYDVYILWGQSNMRGQASIRPGIDDDYSGLQHVYMWDASTASVVRAVNPMPHQDFLAGSTGLWLEFARALPSSRRILFVPVAKGSTGFGIHWNPGNAVYLEAVARMNNAMASNSGNRLKAVLGLQGEADAENNNATYLADIKAMRTAMMMAITGMNATTPWVQGSIAVRNAACAAINTALQQFSSDVPVAKYVNLVDQATFDTVHYSAAAIQVAGARFFAALNNGLKLFTQENFESGTVDPNKIGYQADNSYSSVITTANGSKALRLNLITGGIDPVSGKPNSGWHTHYFKSSNFYTSGVDTYVALEMDYRFDDCFWANDAGDPYPRISGKWYLMDVAQESRGPYISTGDDGKVRIFPDNGATWAGWCSRSYGWRDASGGVALGFYLKPSGINVCAASDGRSRTLRFEIDMLNGGLGHSRGRLIVNGEIWHDERTVNPNTDANGWFNLPPEFIFQGLQIYANSVDNGINSKDRTDFPALYSGYKCGYEVEAYRFYKT
jgi:Carbohydrate esterase, sialic acid-specific acetylesterase